MYFLFSFYKSFSENFSDIRYNHKSAGINEIYQFFQGYDFLTANYTIKQQLVLIRIHSFSMNSCNTAIQLLHNLTGNFFRLAGYDISLLGKLQAFDHAVRNLCDEINSDDGIQRFLHAEHIHTYQHNGSINKLHDLCNGIVAEFPLEQRRHHIGAPCSSSSQEHKTDSHTLDHTAVNSCQQKVIPCNVKSRQHCQPEGQTDLSYQGFFYKLKSPNLHSDQEKRDVQT